MFIALVVLLTVVACKGPVTQGENSQTNLNEKIESTNNAQKKKESVSSFLPKNKRTEADTTSLNQYKDGEKDGLWRLYYQNGKLKSESIYINGKKEGICREWWETGVLWTDGMYQNDKANGLMNWHNDEGLLVASGNMTNGKRDGLWKICGLKTALNCIEINFKMDKKDGSWKIYHDNGQLWKDQSWSEAKILSERCWDEKGNEINCNYFF